MDANTHFRKSLRNPNINYRNGWFFVTTQVAHNKCALGAIVGDRCVLNALGEAALRHASEVWVGDIAPGGLLDTLLEESSRV